MNNITVPSLLCKYTVTKEKLRTLVEEPGSQCREFFFELTIKKDDQYKGVLLVNRNAIDAAREQQDYVQAIIPLLDQRFDSFTEDIFKGCNVFDPFTCLKTFCNSLFLVTQRFVTSSSPISDGYLMRLCPQQICTQL